MSEDSQAAFAAGDIPPQLMRPLRTLLAHAPLVLFALDHRGVFIASEGAGLRALGLRGGEVVGRSVFEIYADQPQISGLIKRVLAGESLKWVVEVGGTWWETHAEPVRDEHGQLIGAVGLATDVTERQRADEQMLETEERFRKLAECTFEAIAIHESGKVILANEACAALFGYDPRELIGMSVVDLAAPESRAVIAERVRQGLDEAYEAVGMCKNGTRFPAELRARMVKYRGRPMRVTVVRDLTPHKRAQAALREVLAMRDGLLRDAATQLDAVLAKADASLGPEQVSKLREVVRLVERARDAVPTDGGPDPAGRLASAR